MLDEKDLKAIQAMITAAKTEMVLEATHNMKVLLDTEVQFHLKLFAEGIQDIQEKLVPRSRVDDMEEEIKFLKSIVRQMNEDLQALKTAN